MRYFRKELPNRTLRDQHGLPVPVIRLNDSIGLVATSDGDLIEYLDTVIGVGGLTAISKAQFTDLKKKSKCETSPSPSKQPEKRGSAKITVSTPKQKSPERNVEVAVAANLPFVPRTGRLTSK
jgi:hypothetical protein|tara:strand:+ start:1764 stop:2132 length:369 start_codon:yes stop_codon:yes gene_type:complete